MAAQTPPAIPAAAAIIRSIAGALSTGKKRTTAALAIAPMKICPSAPMLYTSIVKQSMTAIAAIESGIALTSVSLMPYPSPNAA